MRRLYLDDVRVPLDDSWDVVKSYDEFVQYIKTHGMPDEISFDHDLGYPVALEARSKGMSKRKSRQLKQQELTGYDCAKWLVENYMVPVRFYVHSANPVGADNILHLLNSWQRQSGMIPNGYRTFWPCKTEEEDIC